MLELIRKSMYTGLGLIGSGKQTVEEIGRQLSRRANISEREGEKLARQLFIKSERAVKSLQKTMDAEVKKVVNSLHSGTERQVNKLSGKRKALSRKAKAAKK